MIGRLRAINGFEIIRESREIKIIYTINGVFFTQSIYEHEQISENKIEEVREVLEKYTSINRQAKSMKEVIPLPSMLVAVKKIIS